MEVAAAYVARFNRVVDYIEKHLSTELSLEELADVANFSKFHFHRLFQLHHGETLFRFIRRLRLERAAALLLSDSEATITSISLSVGFSNPSAFSRSFRERFGLSASAWREQGGTKTEQERKASLGIDPRLNLKARWKRFPVTSGFRRGNRFWKSETEDGRLRKVEVKRFDDFDVVYLRHVGPYAADAALFERLYKRLFTWAAPRGLVRFPLDTYCLYHDAPEITSVDKLRVSVCLPAWSEVEVSGEIGRLTIPGGEYAVLSMELSSSEYGEAWSWAYSHWLPGSGYDPDDRNSFEHFHIKQPQDSRAPRNPVNICIPVRPSQ